MERMAFAVYSSSCYCFINSKVVHGRIGIVVVIIIIIVVKTSEDMQHVRTQTIRELKNC